MSISLKCLMNEIERKDMPQVKGKDLPEMMQTLRDNGIAYRKGVIAADKLHPTQEDGIPSKVDAIASGLTQGEPLNPIVISMDGFILDGHHRWLAVKKIYEPDFKMQVVMIMKPKMDALQMFDKVADEVK